MSKIRLRTGFRRNEIYIEESITNYDQYRTIRQDKNSIEAALIRKMSKSPSGEKETIKSIKIST